MTWFIIRRKEKAMNNYYYHKRAEEHQHEISKELATRNLLNGGRHNTSPGLRVAFRMVSVAITVIALILLIFAR